MCLLIVNMLVVCSVLKKVLKYFYNSDVTLACEDVSSTTHKLILSIVSQVLPHTLQPLSITSFWKKAFLTKSIKLESIEFFHNHHTNCYGRDS